MLRKPFLSILFFLVLFQVISYCGLLDQKLFPAPWDVLLNSFEHRSLLIFHAMFTLWRLVLGVILAIMLAVPLAFIISRFKSMNQMVRPLIACFYPIPKIAIYPFVMLVFGTGNLPKIVLITIGAFFLIFSTVINSLDRINNSSLMEVVRVYKISGAKLYCQILWKGASFDFLYGLNLAIGYGLVMSVASEMSAANNGLGFYIWNSWDAYRILDMYSGLMVISVIGLTFHFAIEVVRDRYLDRKII